MRRMEVVCSLVGDYASIMVEGRDKGYSERAMLQLWYEELDKFNKATQQERAYVRSITPTIVSGIFSNSDLSKFNAKATAQVLCIMGPN